ncbi:D-arabinitol 2-dehydrogenase (short-chain dehydrogenase) [Phlyctema vagabunda]|uniref:D-arabinitol 2-dehydrogenase (Short-chain dehydrogenase) n=1 Tax=Phlyctema vagabunda TaxID=108571 RepID=A0ABR4PFB7_9HELO
MSVARSVVNRAFQAANRQTAVRYAKVNGFTANYPKTMGVRFVTNTNQTGYEEVNKKELPILSFSKDGKKEKVIDVAEGTPIEPAAAGPVAGGFESGPCEPLTPGTHDKMTPTMKSMSIMGKTVVVTGGARGLGNNMARACLEAGASKLVIFDVNADNGAACVAELHKLTGVPCSFYCVDIRDDNAIDRAVQQMYDDVGLPDVVINSAGIADSNMPAETYNRDTFRRLIDINLTGAFVICQSIGSRMIAENKPGSMILIASMSGSIVNYPQEQSCYNASKAGVVMMGKSLAAEWAKYNIRVNCISPGYMDTALNNVPTLDGQKAVWKQMTPQKRLGSVDDLNGLAVYLASDSSKFVTGSNIIIDGGYTLW